MYRSWTEDQDLGSGPGGAGPIGPETLDLGPGPRTRDLGPGPGTWDLGSGPIGPGSSCFFKKITRRCRSLVQVLGPGPI